MLLNTYNLKPLFTVAFFILPPHITNNIFLQKGYNITKERRFRNEKEEFKPYISDEHIQTEFTPTAIIIGILLSVVFGAANAYLGLRVGLTISASIPAAVISMGVLRIILRKTQYWKVIWFKL